MELEKNLANNIGALYEIRITELERVIRQTL